MSITIMFIALSILILWIVIGSSGNWKLKFFTILTTLFFSVSVTTSIESMKGWPSSENPPEEFQVLWVIVKEPDKSTDDEGSIFIWVRHTKGPGESSGWKKYLVPFDSHTDGEPRAYKLKYSKDMHIKMVKVSKMLMKGSKVVMTFEKSDGENDNSESGDSYSDSFKLHEIMLPPRVRKNDR